MDDVDLALAPQAAGDVADDAGYLWELDTAENSEQYASLEVTLETGATTRHIPVVPVSLDQEVLTIAVPAELAPWLPAALVWTHRDSIA